jgi:hypothetical protein
MKKCIAPEVKVMVVIIILKIKPRFFQVIFSKKLISLNYLLSFHLFDFQLSFYQLF